MLINKIIKADSKRISGQEKKHEKLTSAQIIDCDTWRIIGPSTESDNKKAKNRIIERIKKAFWL